MPEISIVVPAFQAERYIEICVASILAQTFKDFEVLLVDDGSTDSTAAVCHRLELRDARVRLLQHTRNRGASAARNTGILAAKGKYVAFADSDDLLKDNMLSTLHKAAERWNADVAAAQGLLQTETSSLEIAQSGLEGHEVVMRADNEPLPQEELLPAEMEERLRMFLRYGFLGSPCAKIYRKTFLARHGLLFPMVKTLVEDFPFTACCIFLAERYLRVPCFPYLYCGNPVSLSRKSKTERHLAMVVHSMMEIASYIARYLKEMPFFDEDPSRLEAVQWTWYSLCKKEQIYQKGYYQNGRVSRTVDAAVKGALRGRFGAQADFVAYLFHTMNAHYAEKQSFKADNKIVKGAGHT